MLAHTATIKKLGMTFDYDQVHNSEVQTDYSEANSFGYISPMIVLHNRTEMTIHFKTGDSMTLINPEIEIKRTVDLEVGKIYHVGDGKRKWLAICLDEGYDPFLEDDDQDRLVLKPVIHDEDYPIIDNDDRFNYEFYKEFDLDLKRYL